MLQIGPEATNDDVREAYRRLSFRWHPDRNQHRASEAHARFLEIGAAIDVLGDSESRRRYDAIWQARRGARPTASKGRSPLGDSIRAAASTKSTPVTSWRAGVAARSAVSPKGTGRLRLAALVAFALAAMIFAAVFELMAAADGRTLEFSDRLVQLAGFPLTAAWYWRDAWFSSWPFGRRRERTR